nr:MAG TPA: hypothetical protein [Caudoviricetes sp.]
MLSIFKMRFTAFQYYITNGNICKIAQQINI